MGETDFISTQISCAVEIKELASLSMLANFVNLSTTDA